MDYMHYIEINGIIEMNLDFINIHRKKNAIMVDYSYLVGCVALKKR